MVFRLVWAITFDALCPLYPAWESGMSPFLAIFALENSRIHVCSSDGSDIVANIEASVYKHFSIMSTLNVPYVYPDNCHVGLQRNFDYSWFWHKRDVIEDMILSKNCFDISWCKFFLRVQMGIEWDTDDFQVWFRFGSLTSSTWRELMSLAFFTY